MRLYEFETTNKPPSAADNLKRQADEKTKQAKKLEMNAKSAKNREDIQKLRQKLIKKQGQLSKSSIS